MLGLVLAAVLTSPGPILLVPPSAIGPSGAMENQETITNSTDDFICFTGVGGASDESICLDLDGTNIVEVTTSTGVLTVDFGTINLATDALDLSEGNLTNGGDLQIDSLTPDATNINVTSGNLLLGNTLTLETDSVSIAAPTTDAAPTALLVGSAHAYSQGTQTAADLHLYGGADEKILESTDYANGANDTYTITVNGLAPAGNTRTEGVDWTAATDDATTACSIYDNLIASPISGVTAGRTDGTCSDAKVFIIPTDGATYHVFITVTDAGGGGAFGTATNGSDGDIVLWAENGSEGVRLEIDSGNNLHFRNLADTSVATLYAGTYAGTGIVQAGASSYFGWSGRSELYSPADEQVQFYNAAKNKGYCLVGSTANQLNLYAADCAATGYLDIGGAGKMYMGDTNQFVGASGNNTYVGADAGVYAYLALDNSVNNFGILNVTAHANAEMTASSGSQMGLAIYPEILQTGTASFNAIHVNVTDSSSGSGQDKLLSLNWGGTEKFAASDDGQLSLGGTAPTLSSCGTTPSITGTDSGGKITVGTSASDTCTATFAVAYTNAPTCVVVGDDTAFNYAATTSTTALTITCPGASDFSSDVISYICFGL